MVTDLHHYLDLPEDTPGPAQRLAAHLGVVVRSATAGDVGAARPSALPCRRRPGHRPCPGRIVVLRAEAKGPIQWQCSTCGDAGTISNWADTPFDLSRRRLTVAAEVARTIPITDEVSTALRDLQLLDPESERLVFRIRAEPAGAVLAATDTELEELVGAVAGEANHEPNRRRQQQLDAAFDLLSDAARGW